MGGAERWFGRFLPAMQRHGEAVEAVVRRNSELAHQLPPGLPTRHLGFRTVWDPLSRLEVSRLLASSDAPIVQTYMGRATRLTRLPPGGGRVHVSRLGGYYKLDPFVHAHAWIGNTRGLCDWMIRGGLPAEKVFHITNFADPARDVPPAEVDALRADIALADDDLLMVTAGRLLDVKGHRYLIDALARLPHELHGRRLRLAILGDGDLRAALADQARQAGVGERVLLAGWQRDPAPWFRLADLVVFPSRDPETLGNVILESWAYGRPLVCTAFRGAREIARHGEDAWIVPCDDAAALADGIRAVAGDAPLQQRLTAAGLRRVAQDFSEATVIGQYRALYADLLENR